VQRITFKTPEGAENDEAVHHFEANLIKFEQVWASLDMYGTLWASLDWSW
jgi:hypothetical protein